MARDSDKFKIKIEDLAKSSRSAEGVTNALAFLFPKVEQAIQTYSVFDRTDKGDRTRLRRISSRDSSQYYFGLTPAFATWGRSEIENILNSTAPIAAINEVRARINAAAEKDRATLREVFLDNLSGSFNSDRPFTKEWLLAILDIAADFLSSDDTTKIGLFSFDNMQRFRWVLVEGFRPLTASERFDQFHAAVRKAKDISLLCSFYRTTVGDINPKGAKRQRDELYFGERTEQIRTDLLMRIHRLTRFGSLWKQVDPGAILWFWWGCDREDEVRSFTNKAQRTKSGLRSLLEITLSPVQSTEGNYEQVSERQWSMITDLPTLEERATKIVFNSKNKADVAKAERFLAGLKKGKEERL